MVGGCWRLVGVSWYAMDVRSAWMDGLCLENGNECNESNLSFFIICCRACDINRKMCVCFSFLFIFLVEENHSLSPSLSLSIQNQLVSSNQLRFLSSHCTLSSQ